MDDIGQWIRKNMRIFYLSSIAFTLGSCFLDGGYVQSFLIRIGLSTMEIGVFGASSQLAALLGYGLFLLYRPGRRERYVRGIAWFGFSAAALPAVLMGAAWTRVSVCVIYAGAAAYQLGTALRASCEYSATPMLYPRERYGRMSARCGMAGAGLAALVSAVGASFLAGGDCQYTAFFALALLGLLAGAVSAWGYAPVPGLDADEKADGTFAAKSAASRLAWLLLPHLLRGAASACFYYFVSISLRSVALSPLGQSAFVTVGVAGAMAACLVFIRLQDRFRTGIIIFWSNAVTAAAVVWTCLNASEAGFFALYALYTLSVNVTAYAVPAGVIYNTASDDLPFISSARMLVMSGASCALMTPVAGLLEAAPAWAVMTAGGAAYILSGALFAFQYTDSLKGRGQGGSATADPHRQRR